MTGLFSSIRFRLALWTAAILGAILVAFSIFVFTRQTADLQLRAEARLELLAQQMQSGYHEVREKEDDQAQPRLPDLALISQSEPYSHDILGLTTLDGQILQKAGPIQEETIKRLYQAWRLQTGEAPRALNFAISLSPMESTEAAAGKYIVLITPLLAERRAPGLILIGQPLDPDGELPRLALTLVLGSLATLALALAGGFWVANRAMSPVRTITRTARGISETDLHQRLNLGKKDEIGELADTFDGMLDRLQAAFERQRRFTADASHELRTPLTVVNLEAEQALSRPRGREDYEKSLKIIQSESERMGRLVNDLLTLARMDAGQTTLRLEPLDLSDLALDAAERLTNLARRAQLEIALGDLPPAPVEGDRQYLSQAVANLVENAIKYAGGPGKRIAIETGMEEKGKPKSAWVSVADNGPGIPPEHLPRLFDRFYQADPARVRRPDEENAPSTGGMSGSGLGLAIVQWIVHAHGGRIEVASSLGKGTTFTIYLPAREN